MQQDNQSLSNQLCTKLSGSNKFKPQGEKTLPSLELLLARADPTLNDVSDAAREWRNNPPDDEFVTILDAE
jgi:hypothetical protein